MVPMLVTLSSKGTMPCRQLGAGFDSPRRFPKLSPPPPPSNGQHRAGPYILTIVLLRNC